MENRSSVRAALAIAVGVVTGASCGDSSGPSETPHSFSVYGMYTGKTGEPLENVMVDAGAIVCIHHCPSCFLGCDAWQWEVYAQTWTDTAGRYSLQWSGHCDSDGVPNSSVMCRSLVIPESESCGNFQLRCTDKPQERNCTIQSP
jgi:hypothetical protein